MGSGDSLKVLNLDNGKLKTYNNQDQDQFNRTNDITKFEAASQFYVQWSSDNKNDQSRGSPPPKGYTVSYWCEQANWTITGVGEAVANDDGTVSGASALGS